jgi:2-polyprenyl-6-methoxyphenol hydroxylase-like FAD-dependent oxidoreductase
MQTLETDVVVIGASVAGSATAALFAQQGLSVLVVDRVQDPAAYKRQCTHNILGSALPVLERLGVIDELERAGARRTNLQLWTRASGWVRLALDEERDDRGRPNHGYNIRREKLDPILRDNAARTPGVTLRLSHALSALRRNASGRTIGVELAGPGGATVAATARLVVGADGRHTKVAELAKIEPEVRPHNRGGFMAYYKGLKTRAGSDAQFWILGEDVAYAFPTDDGLTCIAVVVNERRLPEFKADREGFLRRFVAALDGAPDFSEAERVGSFVGVANTPNTYRWPVQAGLALVGDAAMASDYIWGVGCGWALEGAALLVDHVAPALRSGADLDRALDGYARAHKRVLYSQHVQNTAFSASPKLPGLFQSILVAVPRDPKLRRLVALSALGRISQRDLRIPLRLGLHYLVRPLRRSPEAPSPIDARYGLAS